MDRFENIIFYEDRRGRRPVFDYIEELEHSNGKDSRIKAAKIHEYIHMLSTYGAFQLSGIYTKHLEDEIWELRPLRDRILFAGVSNGKYVLLHIFMKETQKTPRREIERAKRELADFKERIDFHEKNL